MLTRACGVLLSFLLSSPGMACVIGDLSESPIITITSSPPDCCYGIWAGTVDGYVNNVDTDASAVVLYVLTNTYYVQPYDSSPWTEINCPDGTFSNQTRGGCRYCAILANRNWTPPPTLFEIPPVGGDILAFDCSLDSSPSGFLDFAGRRWIVKACCGSPCGPGPNWFSDSQDNVWVDDAGRLHLRITERNGEWYCAEVLTDHYLGSGLYQFEAEASIDNLDPQVVLGGFNYSDHYPTDQDEIDVEFSRWGDPAGPNAQFVVQPFEDCLRHQFYLTHTGARSTHEFLWTPDSIHFASRQGGLHEIWEDVETFTCVTTDPDCVQLPDAERMRFNLWLHQGNTPDDSQEVEVVVSDFVFYSWPSEVWTTDAPQSVLDLTQPSPNPGSASLSYQVLLDRRAAVRLAIYDAAGRLVQELFERELAEGSHHFSWIPEGRLPSGVYFLRLDAPGVRTARGFVWTRW